MGIKSDPHFTSVPKLENNFKMRRNQDDVS